MANQKLAIICLVILIFANAIGGYVNYYFDVESTYSSDTVENLGNTLDSSITEDYDASAVKTIMKSISGVIFWSFGNLPWWLDVIMWIFRLIIIFYVVDVILP